MILYFPKRFNNILLFYLFISFLFQVKTDFYSLSQFRQGRLLMDIKMSIFSPPINPEPGAEYFETIQSGKEIRIERIISKGQKSPPGFWYDQEENEWVMLVTGYAELEFEHGITTLKPGDYINIPAGVKHRVSFTSETEETVWLAVFYK